MPHIRTAPRLEDLLESTRRYERWVAARTPVVPSALRLKHARMAESPYAFFRATFFRWTERWGARCKALAGAPPVLAVCDLHVENFGTWRDAEARLVWGVNDFDEAHPAPYTIDLVRLAASARLAAEESRLTLGLSEACDAILDGYERSLRAGGEPLVLADRHPWLREIATGAARDPARFWEKMTALPRFGGQLPRAVTGALEATLPVEGLAYQRRARAAGLGSLGHVRMVALARFQGAWIAREAKALSLSAMARGGAPGRFWCAEAIARAVRARDPFVRIRGGWIVKRLAPDCARVELADLPARRDEARLLRNMGWETANVHLGTPGAARRILPHLRRLPPTWLRDAAREMAGAIADDAALWRRRGRRASA